MIPRLGRCLVLRAEWLHAQAAEQVTARSYRVGGMVRAVHSSDVSRGLVSIVKRSRHVGEATSMSEQPRVPSDGRSLLQYDGVPLLPATDEGFLVLTREDQIVAAVGQPVEQMRGQPTTAARSSDTASRS